MFFSLDISTSSICLFGVGLLTGLAYVAWQWGRVRRLRRFVEQEEHEREYADRLPPVSIIVDACNETDQLSRFLPLVLQQDYLEFEVVVIVNSAAEATGDVLSDLRAQHANLRVTFAPSATRTLSRKKLALMIGIKAAKYDIVLTTCANCRATSDKWLVTMMRNFTPDTDIVLGYSHYRYRRDKRLGRRMRVFDTVSTGAQWLLSGINGHPYRGVTDNLAYRKQLFFDHHGFAHSMELRWGEDDVFLSEIARNATTRVELAPASQLDAYYDNLRHAHPLLKMRRDFTSRLVRRNSFIVQGIMSGLWWTSMVSLICSWIVAWPNAVMPVAVLVAVSILWGMASWAMAGICSMLQAPKLWLSAPLLALWRPVVNVIYRVREAGNRHSNYTSYI